MSRGGSRSCSRRSPTADADATPPPPPRARAPRRRVAASVAVGFGLLAAAELGLRLAGFRHESVPRVLAFDLNATGTPFSEPDRELFWRLRRSTTIDDAANFRIRIGPAGLRDEPAARPGAPARRILCLGDSCTFGRATTYPRELRRIFDGDAGPGAVEVVNAGIPGYSTTQGLRFLRGALGGERFDLVTVYFGFNDAKPATSPDSARPIPSPGLWRLRSLFGRLRLYQAMTRLQARGRPDAAAGPTTNSRVPPDEYRRNLEAIVDEAGRRSAASILLTVPSLLRPDGDEGRALASRNEIVRAVGRERGVPVVDLESRFAGEGNRGLFDGTVESVPGSGVPPDPIHPNEPGLRLVAEEVRRAIDEHGLLPGIARAPDRLSPAGSFAFGVGDVDGGEGDELFACAAVADGVEVARLDETGRRAGEASLPLRPDGAGAIFLALSADGRRLFAADATAGSVVAFEDGTIVARGDLATGLEGGALTGLAAPEGFEGPVLAVAGTAGPALARLDRSLRLVERRPLQVPSFAASDRWSIAGSPFPVSPILAAPDPARPRPGWIGFAGVSRSGAMVEGCLAFGFGGFDAGLRLAASSRTRRAYAARGGCARAFERMETRSATPWLPVDALFPFGFTADRFEGLGLALAVRGRAQRGADAAVFVAGVSEGEPVLLELDPVLALRRRSSRR